MLRDRNGDGVQDLTRRHSDGVGSQHRRTGSELGLARIIRSENKIMVDGWRALNTTQSQHAADQHDRRCRMARCH